MNIRDFQSRFDLEMVREWWAGHTSFGAFPERLLPPVGVVVQDDGEDIAACWLYMAVGIGVCWLECAVSKPGLTLSRVTEAFLVAVAGLEEIAKTHDYGVMFAHTLPPIARMLERSGFKIDSPEKVTTVKLLHGLRN